MPLMFIRRIVSSITATKAVEVIFSARYNPILENPLSQLLNQAIKI